LVSIIIDKYIIYKMDILLFLSQTANKERRTHMKNELEEVLGVGEIQSLEFKKSLNLQKEALEALCGMINTDCGEGKVIFGINPDNSICGVEPGNIDTAQRSLNQTIKQKFDPPLIVSIELIKYKGKILLSVKAERTKNIPYYEYDGRAYIREGTEKRLLSIEEKNNISLRRNRDKHNGPWKCDCCGSIFGQVSILELTDQGPKKSYTCGCGGELWPI
jgi:hypothetical protein